MQTLVQLETFEAEIKKSRFLALAAPVDSPEEALAWLSEHHHVDASHHCWAYRIGQLYRFNDDGEPTGSAGKPILAAIDGQDLDRVVCVVIRWFGGTKLGVGGLVRAYGGTAAQCLRNATHAPIVMMTTHRVRIPFDSTGAVHALLDQNHATKLSENWTESGLELEFEIAEGAVEFLRDTLRDGTSGRIYWMDE